MYFSLSDGAKRDLVSCSVSLAACVVATVASTYLRDRSWSESGDGSVVRVGIVPGTKERMSLERVFNISWLCIKRIRFDSTPVQWPIRLCLTIGARGGVGGQLPRICEGYFQHDYRVNN